MAETPEERRARIRWLVLREWRGGSEPRSLDAGMHDATDFLEDILRSTGAREGVEEERLRELWREIAGDLIAQHSAPVSLQHGCLRLRVLHPAMRFQLEQMKGELLANLKKELGAGVVKSIRFMVG